MMELVEGSANFTIPEPSIRYPDILQFVDVNTDSYCTNYFATV